VGTRGMRGMGGMGGMFEKGGFARRVAVGLSVAMLGGLVAVAQGATPALAGPPAGFTKQVVLSGLYNGGDVATNFAYTNDGRMFVTYKGGVVKVYDLTTGVGTVYVDLSARVNALQGRGLLGLALDPNFATNRYVYVLFTEELRPDDPDQDHPAGGTLLRMNSLPGTPDVADATSFFTLLTGYDSFSKVHGIGTIHFDGNGNLLASFGDAQENGVHTASLDALSPDSLHGKVIRIDPATGNGVPSNPFYEVGNPGSVRSKVLAMGLRNPFEFWPDPVTGEVYIGNVGWQTWEALDVVPATITNPQLQVNFGWPCYEGGNRQPLPQPAYAADSTTAPTCYALYTPADGGTGEGVAPSAYAYLHSETGGETGSSIIAGPLYRGTTYPAQYQGQYFLSDFSRGLFRTYDPSTTAVADFGTQGQWGGPVNTQVAPDGNLVYLDLPGGAIYEIVYTGVDNVPVATASVDQPFSATAPATVNFSSAGSSDADPGDTLTYKWDFGDGTPLGCSVCSEPNPAHTYSSAGSYYVTLTVDDGHQGGKARASLWVDVANHAPTISIDSPLPSLLWKTGDTIDVSITANDQEDGPLTGASVVWAVTLHHLQHIHPDSTHVGTSGSFQTNPDGDEQIYYDITATATDVYGRSATTVVNIYPKKQPMTVTSSPPGATVIIEGVPYTTPTTFQGVVNQPHTIQVDQHFLVGDTVYKFNHWNDDPPATNSFSFVVPDAPLTINAAYNGIVPGISISDIKFLEGDQGFRTVSFDITLSRPNTNSVSVNWATHDGTATAAEGDYSADDGLLTIAPGNTSKKVSIRVNPDTIVEGDETFSVVLSNPVGDAIIKGTGIATIINDDPGSPDLRVGVSDVTMTEGDSGQREATFDVTLSAASPSGVSVGYNTLDGTAVAGSDYVAKSGTLNFGLNQHKKTVTVRVNGDGSVEPDETFSVVLTNPLGLTIERGVGTGTIENDDEATLVSVSDFTIPEGDSGDRVLNAPVVLSQTSLLPVTVNWTMAHGTTDSADVSLTGGTLVIPAGATTGTVSFHQYADTTVEPDETFTITLTSAQNALIAHATATATIVNDDPFVPGIHWMIGDTSVREGTSGNRDAMFQVVLSTPAQVTVNVNYAVVLLTANSKDVAVQSGTVRITTKSSAATQLRIPVHGDATAEPDEQFKVVLSNPSTGSTIADDTGIGTIINDDV
jgi:glucose/arabinose dehydrogenase